MRDIPWRRVAALVLVVLAAVLGAKVTFDESGLPPVAPAPSVSPTPTAAPTVAPTPAPATAVAGSDLADNLRAEPDVVGKAAGAAKTSDLARNLAPRGPPATGKTVGPKCQVDYSGHVYSDRTARPTEFVLHYTVSHNAKGWGDVYAIRDYFKRTRVGSAHFILDFEGHCLKMVPLRSKAWTQGNANSYAYSVEIIAYGNEPAREWKAAPIFRDKILAGLVRRVMDYGGLPLRRVDPDGCVFVPGWDDHEALECGNDHQDVTPHFPYRLFGRQLRAVR